MVKQDNQQGREIILPVFFCCQSIWKELLTTEPVGAERREDYLGNYDYGKENRKDHRGIDPAVLGRRKRKMKGIRIVLFVLGCGLELISIMEDA